MEIREEWQGKKSIPTLDLETSISTWGNEYPEPSEKENPKPSYLSNGLSKEKITRLDIIVEETNASHTIDEMNVKKIFVF